jgi:exopolysaccharide biosynthesis polyprenyl glycosylphosphotransferase
MALSLPAVIDAAVPPVLSSSSCTVRRLPTSMTALFVPLADVLAVLVGAVLADLPRTPTFVWFTLAAFVLLSAGRDRAMLTPRMSSEVGAVAGRLAVASVLVAPLARSDGERGRLLLAAPAVLVLVLAGRAVAYGATRAARSRHAGLEPAVIVGAGPVGVNVANLLLQRPEHGLLPVGFVDAVADTDLPLPVLGHPRDLRTVVAARGLRRVVLAFGVARESEIVGALRDCADLSVDVHVVPRFFELGTSEGPSTDELWGFPLVHLRRTAHRGAAWRAKRAFDVVVASTALVLTAPLSLACAVAVRLTSPGPVLFRQKRVGQFGQPIEILKFRTMRMNDDSDTTWSVTHDDDRVTSAGRLLRPTHLDELPQLLNVLRGQMSIVGPRPERPCFCDRFSVEVPGYRDRHRVPVGITGWAQVHGLWGDTSIEDRARFDNRYIEQWSLWRDAVILLRTIPTMLSRR